MQPHCDHIHTRMTWRQDSTYIFHLVVSTNTTDCQHTVLYLPPTRVRDKKMLQHMWPLPWWHNMMHDSSDKVQWQWQWWRDGTDCWCHGGMAMRDNWWQCQCRHDDVEVMQASDDNDDVTAMEGIHDVTNYLRLALVNYSVVSWYPECNTCWHHESNQARFLPMQWTLPEFDYISVQHTSMYCYLPPPWSYDNSNESVQQVQGTMMVRDDDAAVLGTEWQ